MPEAVGDSQPAKLAEQLLELRLPGEPASESLTARLRGADPIDLARAFGHLEIEQVAPLFDLLGGEPQAIVLAEVEPDVQAFLLMHVGDRGGADLVSTLDPDDAADVLEGVEPELREQILGKLDSEDAREIRHLAGYGPETAGGLMTTEFVAVSAAATGAEALDTLRKEGAEAETINVIFVISEGCLVGVFSIRELIQAPADAVVADFMTRELRIAVPDDDQEHVLRLMETYHLAVLPVVDSHRRLLGIVTIDDALTAMEEEGSEDVMRIAGAPIELPTHQTILERVKARLPWLVVTLIGGSFAALIIKTLGREVIPTAVGRFLPIIGGMGGNVAMQSAAILVRGFATGEIDASRMGRLIWDEMAVGALIGLICGLGAGLIAMLMTSGPETWSTAGAVALSLFIATTLAALGGTIIPTVCHRMGIDPAITAGPFITTLNDVLGFTVYILISASLFGISID